MKIFIITIIILISIASFYGIVPSTDLVFIYGILAIAPFILTYLRKNLVNGLLLWFLFVMFKEFGKIRLPVLPDLSPERIIWLILISLFFLDVALRRIHIVSGDFKVETAMFLFTISILFSSIIVGSAYEEGHGLKLSYILTYAIPFSIFFLAKNLVYDERAIRKVFIFLSIIGFYLGITAIFEHFKLSYLIFPGYISNPRLGLHYGQARGPFLQAGMNGMVMGMLFFISFYLMVRESNKLTKALLFIGNISLLAGILYTLNRGSWIQFILASSLLPIFFPKVRKVYLVSSLVLCLSLFLILSKPSQLKHKQLGALGLKNIDTTTEAIEHRFESKSSIYARINVYGASLKMFLERPIFGFGFNKFKKMSPEYFSKIEGIPLTGEGMTAHNSLVLILVELGLVGFSIFLFILLHMLYIMRNLYRVLPPDGFLSKGLAVIFGGIFIVYFVGMNGRDIQYDVYPNAIFYLMAGIIAGLYNRVLINKKSLHSA